ncbi:MAG: DUF1549 and DUF1553 domain-containing protein [Tepidisphaeraceae bacterium]
MRSVTIMALALAGLCVAVRAEDKPQPAPSFKLDVMPVFFNSGCNTGACHGAAKGKDGFRLSLFGYDPDGDYQRLTREIPGRRLNLAFPEESLLLKKTTGQAPHTGGKRFEPDSENYNTILRWVAAGAPADPPNLPRVVAVEIAPTSILLSGENASQQLSVKAKYSDNSIRDVTRLAVYITSNDNSAAVSAGGMLKSGRPGEAFIMARYDVFNVGVPVIVIPANAPPLPAEFPATNYIDSQINQKLRKMCIQPSPLCTDAVFIRRLYIDTVGLLPPPDKTTAFVASKDPAKREKLVDELLSRPEFIEIWTMKWGEKLEIRSENDRISYKAALQYYNWLHDRLAADVPFDQIVRELLTASGGTFANPAANYYQTETETLKLAENTAQVFMGMRVQCAQCHNHPFDRWTLEDYYGFASFFSQVGRKKGEDPRETIVFNSGGGEVNHPVAMKPVPPKFLGGDTAAITGRDRRQVLASWLASSENPYFARNIANIVWQHFFGCGIVEPVDDVRISNPPANPELLQALATRLVEYQYDFRRLVRDICLSRTYQLAAEPNASNQDDVRNFSHAAIRRIRAEVLLDCINQVAETRDKFKGLPSGARAVQIADGKTTNYFLTTFGRPSRESVCACEVVIEPNLSQALHLLNGETVNRKIAEGGLIKRLLAEKQTPADIIAQLYLRAFSRRPTGKELTGLITLTKADEPKQRQKSLEDAFWAILNSKEFVFNH